MDSDLDSDSDSDDTDFLSATPMGPLWTTDLLDVLLDVKAGGEAMTASGRGTSDAGRPWTTSGAGACDFSVQAP
ncbi:hypothetical protein [Streptomyces sp. NPDC059957]|uniref:hypothetical protein n=1 Tax=unclassified Streptomyces TaxID=2593676 RepID=UPI00364C8D63